MAPVAGSKMKITRGHSVKSFLESVFKQLEQSREYFKRRLDDLVKYYLHYYRYRHHKIVGCALRFRKNRAVVEYNVLRIRGGLARRRRKPRTRMFYGMPIKTRPARKLKMDLRSKRKPRTHNDNLPVQLQNVSSSTTISELLVKNNAVADDERIAQIDDVAAPTSATAPVAVPQVIQHANKSDVNDTIDISKTVSVSVNVSVGVTPQPTTPSQINESDENGTNIWNLDLATVASEMADDDSKADEDVVDESLVSENDMSMSTKEPVTTSTPILRNDDAVFQSPAARSTENINDRLRRQLQLLKMGKPENVTKATATLQPTRISLRRNTIASNPEKLDPQNTKAKSDETSTKSFSLNVSPHITRNSSRNSIDAAQESLLEVPYKKKTTGLIDSLFNRLKSMNGQQSPSDSKAAPSNGPNTRHASKRRSSTPLNDKRAVKVSRTTAEQTRKPSPLTVREMLEIKRTGDEKSKKNDEAEDDDDNVSTSSSGADFLGFDNLNKNVDVSALMPTPRTSKSSKGSVFVSEYLDTFMKENALDSVTPLDIAKPKKTGPIDEALITDSAKPPALTIPERPVDMQRPRTLAQKRQILQRQQDVLHQMIEHESSVYHELRKRVRLGSAYNNEGLRYIQDAELPFTRDCWRATCWINTETNYFFYRTILADGVELKLHGGRGNNAIKSHCELSDEIVDESKPTKCIKCPSFGNIKINNYEEFKREIVEHRNMSEMSTPVKLLNNLKREYIKPCPLSKKPRAAKRTSFYMEYGPLEILTLPTVQLEVWPSIGQPLPDSLKPLLKTILPESNVITPEWAEFAMSVVVPPKPAKQRPQKQHRKYKPPSLGRPSFVFDIPYVNNQTRIIVRRRRPSMAPNDGVKCDPIESFYQPAKPLEFTKKVDRSDAVASECADVLSSMIESVALSLNQNNFIRFDPDLDFVGKIVPIAATSNSVMDDSHVPTSLDPAAKEKIVGTAKMDKGTSKLKVMKELKRLNVTIINAVPDEQPVEEIVKEECKNTFCRFGCVCESIAKTTSLTNRCSNTKCMFVCKCGGPTNQPHFNVPVDLLNKDLGNLHAKATARLAKEEKDFTSTIVVSDRDMFVLPNSQRSSKRSTKKPKRYNESLDSFENFEEIDTAQHPPAKRPRTSLTNHYSYDPNIINAIRHVTVTMKKLPELDVEPWCMVHRLYKCFCKGTALIGKPFSFINAATTTNEKKSEEIVDDAVKYNHWETAPARRRQYSFDRGSSAATPMSAAQVYEELKTMRSARTSPLDWKNDCQGRTIEEICGLRRQCDIMEIPLRGMLDAMVEKCREKFMEERRILRIAAKIAETLPAAEKRQLPSMLQQRPTQPPQPQTMPQARAVAAKRVTAASVAATKRPEIRETSVTKLNRIITNHMRKVCAIQRQNEMKLDRDTPISVVRWDRILTALQLNEVFVWHTTLTDRSTVLLLTNNPNKSKPISQNIQCSADIFETEYDSLPILAKMMRMYVQNDETTQLAVLLYRCSSFWRVVGAMHSHKLYIYEGVNAIPSAEENPHLTQKINNLHQLLVRRDRRSILNAAANNPTPPSAPTAPLTRTVQTRSNLTLDTLSNMNGSQLQLLLPIPLSKDQRWLMVTLGTDFTHIWLPQWRNFLSVKRIRSALAYAAQTQKTIQLSSPNSHPSVFVTGVRHNQIFIGPYQINESQQLTLYFRDTSGQFHLSECYAKLPNVPPFLRRSIGSWIYTDAEAASSAAAVATPRIDKPNTVTAKLPPIRITQRPTSELKIQNVYSIGESVKGISTLIGKPGKPVPMIKYPSQANQVIRLVKPVAPNAQTSTSKVIVGPNTSNTKTPTSNAPVIITKLSSHLQKFPIISSIRSLSEPVASGSVLPIISSVQSGNMVQKRSVNVTRTETASASASSTPISSQASEASEMNSDALTLVEVVSLADPTPTKSEVMTDSPASTNGNAMDIIDLSDDEDANGTSIDRKPTTNQNNQSQTIVFNSRSRIVGYIICPENKNLGKIPAEVLGKAITLRIGSCDKECELPLDVDGNESFDCLNTVDKYMSQLITNIAYSVHPKNLLLKWKFCPEYDDEHKALPIHSTKSLNSYSVVFKDMSLSIQSNYAARKDVDSERKYILDVEKLASQVLPRDVAKKCQLKEIIYKAQEIEKQLEADRLQLAALRDRYSRAVAGKLKTLRALQIQRKAEIRAQGPE